MEIKDIFKYHIGDIGRYQIFIVTIWTISRIPPVFHIIGSVFFAATPDHWCAYPRHLEINLTDEEWKKFSIPSTLINGKLKYSRCEIYTWTDGTNITIHDVKDVLVAIGNGTSYGSQLLRKCDEWEYDRETTVRTSLVTEWDMVCDRSWMKSLLVSVYMVGWMVSGQVFGYASDRYGRRPWMRLLAVGVIIVGNVLPFCSNYFAFLLLRAVLAVCQGNLSIISFAIALELVGESQRTSVVNGMEVAVSVFYAGLALPAYFLRDRFVFMISLSVTTVLMLIPIWFIPESLHWLTAKGHQERAQRSIEKIAKINGRQIPPSLYVTVEEDTEKRSSNLKDLFRSSGLRRVTIIMGINGFVNGITYYAIAWNMADYHGNLYLNVFFSGLVEIPAYLLNILVISKVGRQRGLVICTFVAGVALLLTLAVPDNEVIGKTILVMIGKFAITMSFTAAYQFDIELYPTVIRSSGLHWFVNACRCGSLTAPFLPLFGGIWPDLICGCIAVFGAFWMLFLPETRDVPLPSNVEEADRRVRSHQIRNFFKDVKQPSTKIPEEVVLNDINNIN